MTSEELKNQIEIEKIRSRTESFKNSPLKFIFWEVLDKIISTVFWLGFFLIIAQCDCKCIIN